MEIILYIIPYLMNIFKEIYKTWAHRKNLF